MQDILVGVIVLAAMVYLARTFWLSSKGGGCGGACGKKTCAPKPQDELIQISFDKRH
ncbi:MAG TPA: FeoB-associated Cys-rich membrane protein [Abditibacteriaceae bacterium]|jgi:hypothetical protein